MGENDLIGMVAGPKLTRIKEVTAVVFVIYSMVVVSKLPSYFGVYIAMAQYLSIALLLALLLHFLTPRRGAKVVHWGDALPLLLGLPGIIFVAFSYDKVIGYEAYGFLDTKGVIFAFSLAVGLLIAAWRRTTLAMPIIVVIFLLVARFQDYLPGLLHGGGYDWNRLGYSFYVGTHGIFGVPFKIAATTLIGFIVFGRLFQGAGGGTWFLNLALSLLGSVRGGVAKGAVLASALFGMISGSPTANTASTGAITIPMMKEAGYKGSLAGAIEAVASTGGQFMPPVMGAIIFIMAEWLDISYGSIALAATIPAITYFTIVFASVHFEALKSDRPVIARTEVIPFSQLLKDGWFYIIPFATLISLLVVFKFDPARSALASTLVLITCSFLSKHKENRLYPKRIWSNLVAGVETWLTVGTVTATVGMIIGALTLSGLGIKFSSFLIDVSGGNLLLMLAMVGIASLILGMGLDSIPMYITVAILTAPALMQAGVPPIAAHLFVIYWGLASFITPPVSLAVYVACGISGAGTWETGGNAVRLGIGAFLIPFAFVLSPALLLMGSPIEIIVATVMTILGATALASGLMGYCLKSAGWLQRAIFIVGGILMILSGYLRIIGLILVAAGVLWQWIERKQMIARDQI